MDTVVLSVPNISCGHCERTITEALRGRDGVRSVQVDIASKEVRLEFDPARLTLDQVKAILAEEDYPVEAVRAG